MRNTKKTVASAVSIAVVLATAMGSSAALAQQGYPSRAIKLIVPYQPGTGPDNSARIISEAMTRIMGQPIVVENRGGVSGNLGAQTAARATADGYTWVYSGSPMATSMRMFKQPGFDVFKDFEHVGRMSQSDSILIVRADSDIESVADLIAHLKREPGAMSYASGGVGTPSHMGAEMFLSGTGTQALHVPYKGASESTTAVASNQVDFAVAMVSPALNYVHSHKLRPLAVMSPHRNPVLKDVPTLDELGLSGMTLVSFGGISVPKGTPASVIEAINAALVQAMNQPETRSKLESIGANIALGTGTQMTQDLKYEIEWTEQMMQSLGITAQ